MASKGQTESRQLERTVSKLIDPGVIEPHCQYYLSTNIVEINNRPNTRVVFINENGELLVANPYPDECYHYYPDGPLCEYNESKKEYVDEITLGEPLPDRYLTSEWHPVDRQWRYNLINDCF